MKDIGVANCRLLVTLYTTKISKSVCKYVSMYGYAFRRAETWHGGRGWAREVWEHIFEATWPKVKGHPQVICCFRNALWPPNLVGKTPDQSKVQCWGQRSYRSQLGSISGQIGHECPMAIKFGRKNLWPKWSAMLGSKVIWGQIRVNRRSNCLEMPYSHQRWLMPL